MAKFYPAGEAELRYQAAKGSLPRYVEDHVRYLESRVRDLEDALKESRGHREETLIKVDASVSSLTTGVPDMYLDNDARLVFDDNLSVRYAHRSGEDILGLEIMSQRGGLSVRPRATNYIIVRSAP